MPIRVLIAGATGLVGAHLQTLLLENTQVGHVVSLRRTPGGLSTAKLAEITVRYGEPTAFDDLETPDVVFCCLGTTMSNAGSREAFRKVDYQYPMNLARWARTAGSKAFHLVSSMGANPQSPVFYSRIKGEMERDLGALDFTTTCIYRPSLLLGDRRENRTGERLAQVVMPLFSSLMQGPFKQYRPIRAEDVARAMVIMALRQPPGLTILPSDQLADLAKS